MPDISVNLLASMTTASISRLTEEVNSSFAQMDKVFDNLRGHLATLASFRRRESNLGKFHLPSESTSTNANQINPYIDPRILARVNLSFGASVADSADKAFEALNLLRLLALKVHDFSYLLTASLKQAVESSHCSLFLCSEIVDGLAQLSESLTDEIDLISRWVYSNNFPDLTPRFHSFGLSLPCWSGEMMSCILWRKEMYPRMIHFRN